jgi:hypothetical protein
MKLGSSSAAERIKTTMEVIMAAQNIEEQQMRASLDCLGRVPRNANTERISPYRRANPVRYVRTGLIFV